VVAGHGWKEGVIGYTYAMADKTSPQVRAFKTGVPVFSHIKNSKEFQFPAFYLEHKVLSTIDILIKGNNLPFGVLELDSIKHDAFDKYDINFLTIFANILAEAINSANKTQRLRNAVKKQQKLIREKSALIEQKVVLAAEAHHRVRNNLQIIHGMLVRRMSEFGMDEDASHNTLRKIASRVMAMAHVYDQLLVSTSEKGISVSAYLAALISEIQEIYSTLRPKVELNKTLEDIQMNLDRASVLGLIVTELLTNAYMHAFPKGVGKIQVTFQQTPKRNMAQLIVSDDGIGFDDTKQSNRAGIRLIKMLVEQIEGEIHISIKKGSRFVVEIPV
jgi:two-component sensor histidine kinase